MKDTALWGIWIILIGVMAACFQIWDALISLEKDVARVAVTLEQSSSRSK